MAANMSVIVSCCFGKASQVTDRFHVQKLACDAFTGYEDCSSLAGY